jgi:hypothetical protein
MSTFQTLWDKRGLQTGCSYDESKVSLAKASILNVLNCNSILWHPDVLNILKLMYFHLSINEIIDV